MPENSSHTSPQKPFLGILFKCCRVYARIYLNHDETAFTGHCPRCAARITVKVGPDGSDNRFWTAE